MGIFSQDELISLLQLTNIDGLGPNKIRSLLNNFNSPLEVFKADIVSLLKVEGISYTLAKRILNEGNQNTHLKFAEYQLSRLEKNNSHIITFWDEEYPYYLRKIYDPPVLLFVKGEIIKEDEQSIGVIGTRNPTEYGKKSTELFVSQLIDYNFTIVSGLARGIDTIAHSTSIKYKGRTIAVLGSGLDVIYPFENKKLADSITENGAIISEYPFGTKPDAGNFPRRNRIISGLSLGVLIIETDITGGAMITGKYAIEQNREVFAVPGNIDSRQSLGTNYLIQTGQAKLVTKVQDILDEFGLKIQVKEKQEKSIDLNELNMFEQKIYQIFNNDVLHIDQISEKTGLSSSECLVHLLSLEFKGIIKQLPGKYFQKV